MSEIRKVGAWYVVEGPRCLLVLSKAELVRALRRGKWWKRSQAMRARLAKGKGA